MELGHYGWSRNLNYFQTHAEFLVKTAPATPNYGVFNIGDGPFDGLSTGFFVGSSTGTELGINAASGFTGNLADLQLAGTSKFKVDSTGALTITGTLTLPTQSGNVVFSSPSGGGSGVPGFRALVAADIPNHDASKITTGALALARGGTALDTSTVTDGQLLIGQSTDHTFGLATLTAGTNITITNAGHSISIASTGGSVPAAVSAESLIGALYSFN